MVPENCYPIVYELFQNPSTFTINSWNQEAVVWPTVEQRINCIFCSTTGIEFISLTSPVLCDVPRLLDCIMYVFLLAQAIAIYEKRTVFRGFSYVKYTLNNSV